MFFGIVVLLSDPSTVDVSWSHVELAHESLDIVKPCVGRCVDVSYVVICVDRRLVRIIEKKITMEMLITLYIFESFCLRKKIFKNCVGWMHINGLNS